MSCQIFLNGGASGESGVKRLAEIGRGDVEGHLGIPAPRVARHLRHGKTHPWYCVGARDNPRVQGRGDDSHRSGDNSQERLGGALPRNRRPDPAASEPRRESLGFIEGNRSRTQCPCT